MEPRESIPKSSLSLFLIAVGLFVAGRYLGGVLFENNWALGHWRSLPAWYGPAWIVVCAGLLHIAYHYAERIAGLIDRRWVAPVALTGAAILAVLVSFDSFVYGGGNLLVAQTARVETLVIGWSEPLSSLLIVALQKVTALFASKSHIAAWYAWRLYAYLFAALAVWGAIRLANELTKDKLQRLWLGLIVLMGGQTLVLLGFVGTEAVVVAAGVWFALYALRSLRKQRTSDLAAMWGIAVLAVGLYVGNLFLLPAAVYATLSVLTRGSKGLVAWLGAAVTGIALLCGLYGYAEGSFVFSRYLMFLTGQNPFGDYGLLSWRHLGDLLQIMLVGAPLVIVAAGTAIPGQKHDRQSRGLALALAGGGLVALVTQNPVNGASFDFPRLAAYLAPMAILLAVSVAAGSRRWVGMLAIFALLTPLAFLPSYVCIEQTGGYVTPYLDKHPALYRDACLTFRDAYFARGEFSRADEWERQLPLKSPEVINLRGIASLSTQGDTEEALRVLYPVIARFPYWSEPRDLAARIQMRAGRFALARPQIDTLLMIDPHDKGGLTLQYEFLRDGQNMPEALAQATKMRALYPRDKDVAIDFMIANYRSGQFATADSVAGGLLTADSTLGYPHLIKGLIAERNGLTSAAVTHYHRFIALSPNAPEVATARKRLSQLEGNSAPTP
jgi:Flp pilus assembly protein TadD